MENVPGMVSPKHIQAFNEFLNLFCDAGYTTKYELIDAIDFKIPQNRLRVFIVGIRKDINVEYIFPIKLDSKPVTLLEAIGDLKVAPIPYQDELVRVQKSPIPNHDYYTGIFDKKFMARNRVRGWEEQSYTIQAQAKNEPLHPQAPKMVYVSSDERAFVKGKEFLYRRLSVRECARIQTFPDSFKFVYNNVVDGYKMVGNAVPPRLAYYLALSINSCLSTLLPNVKDHNLVLVGYVKSESDFNVVRKEHIYYIRGGNRPGAMQYGQFAKPIKWLMLHHKSKRELYELLSGRTEKCHANYLKSLGFKPTGKDYWLFRIKEQVNDVKILTTLNNQVDCSKPYPQIVMIENE